MIPIVSIAIAAMMLAQVPELKTFRKAGDVVPPTPVAAPVIPSTFSPASPTEPTRIALDFKEQPVAEVIRAIGTRTAGMVALPDGYQGEQPWGQARITLAAPAPMSFWEAVDRLSEAGKLQRFLTPSGLFGNPRPRIQFQASYGQEGPDYGPATYVGPFRLGPVTVHERFDRVFGGPKRGVGLPTNDLMPKFHAEIPLQAEPGLHFVRTAPMKGLEALDDVGQSLLDPVARGEELGFGQSRPETHDPTTLIVAMVRPARPSKSLSILRGLVPIEIARRPNKPTTVIALAGASGKTTRDGDIAVTVREFKANESGQLTLKFTLKVEGKRGEADPRSKAIRDARLWSILYHQLDLVDADGKPVNLNGGGGPNGAGELNLGYYFTPSPIGSKGSVPTELRIYRPEWVAWDMPFEFKDLPLP